MKGKDLKDVSVSLTETGSRTRSSLTTWTPRATLRLGMLLQDSPVANDIAAVLGYADPAKTISTKVSKKNKGVADLVTPGGIQSVAVLKEAGIYQLIFGSKLASAEEFQDWVFEDVLPSIRKTGSYSIEEEDDESVEMFELDDRTMELIEAWVYYRKLPSIKAAWEEYNHPDQKLEGFASPAEAATLSDRYKAISDMAFEYLSGLWMLENRAFSDAAIEKISNRFLTPEHVSAAVEFQLELDRTQLAAAPTQKQLR